MCVRGCRKQIKYRNECTLCMHVHSGKSKKEYEIMLLATYVTCKTLQIRNTKLKRMTALTCIDAHGALREIHAYRLHNELFKKDSLLKEHFS